MTNLARQAESHTQERGREMTEDKSLALRADATLVLERVIVEGDLSKLTPAECVAYYRAVCESIDVNPLTKPFDYLMLNGKKILYANKSCTDQLRANRRISVAIVAREPVGDVYVVTARATDVGGRSDESIGAVSVAGLRGADLANAYMKAETKSKRRATLSLVGLGLLDETEVETIKDARIVRAEVVDNSNEYSLPPTAPDWPDPDQPEPEVERPLSPEESQRQVVEKLVDDLGRKVDVDFRKWFVTECTGGKGSWEKATVDQLLVAEDKIKALIAKKAS